MNVLVFNTRVEGHHIEHLLHIARYVVKNDLKYNLYMAVNPYINNYGEELVRISNNSSAVSLLPIPEDEYCDPESHSPVRRSLAGWRSAKKRALEVSADHCVFMEMNVYQAVLGLPRARGMPFDTSGILFFPYCRIESSGGMLAHFRSMTERIRKRLQLRWVLSNPSVDTIFLLNDEWGAEKMNAELGTDVFHSLPDPIPPLTVDDNETDRVSSWKEEWWGADRMHFLLFGSLRRDKGVQEAIRAFCNLSSKMASGAAFHLLGASREELETELPSLVSKLEREQPNLLVHFEDRFLSETELDCALSESDVILAPYQRTEGSSGVLSHAANYHVPVIGPKTGLIGHLIREYGLGETVNARSPDRLRESIAAYLNDKNLEWSPPAMERYVAERSPDEFASTLLSTLTDS
ncbi:glycosyltransferase [Salinibacter sp.]|uniref:glycosyltransferase n=1 Tax=Salinibacter sp. TaxID=2065818 RepID=UPI0021E83C9A|nr:glycosyltransferase [Salinibacter sp.]